MAMRVLLGATISAAVLAAATVVGAGTAAAGEIPTPVADVYAVDYATELTVPVEQGLLVNDDPGFFRGMVVTGVDTSGLAGSVAVDAVGSLRFTPAAGFHGETSFLYRLADGVTGQTSVSQARAVFEVGDVAARPDSYHLAVDVPALVVDEPAQGLLANDLSAGLAVGGASLWAGPGHGMVGIAEDGTFTYAPATGFAGTDTFAYTITGATNTSTTTVTVVVDPPNADVSVVVRSDVAKPAVGSTLTLRVVVRNAGPRRTGAVAVGLDVAPGLKITAAPGGFVTGKGASAVRSLPALGVGKSVTWSVTVVVRPGATGAQSVTSAVRSLDLADLTAANDRSSITLRVAAP